MKVSVKQEGLQKVIDIDGKTLYPTGFMSYNPEKENVERMKQQGIKLFIFPIYFGDEGINMESGLRPFYDNFFTGYGEYNYAVVDELMERIVGDADDIYVIPRVCLEPPKWWQQMYPDEVSRDYRGEPQRECYASEKWREDMTVALQALIDHMENSRWQRNVIGYHIAAGGTEEWAYQARYAKQYYDYSAPNMRAYRKFLQEKYGTVQALSESWKQEIPSWEDIRFPTPVERTYARKGFLRDPEDEKPVLDYYDFHSGIVADTICYFCKQVKDYTNGERITGVFAGYVFAIPMSRKGMHAQGKVLQSPYVDYISTTNWGLGWNFSCAVYSAFLNGKMWLAEADFKTCLNRPLGQAMPHAAPDNDYYSNPREWIPNESMEMSCYKLIRGLARLLTAPCGNWWCDHFGGSFRDERLEKIISKTEPLMRQQSHNYLKTEVAVIVDETGYKYCGMPESTYRPQHNELRDNLDLMGTTYHTYLASDLQRETFPVDDYKLYIFVAAYDPSKEVVEAINRKLKRGGKTLLWLHTSSCYNQELSGFSLQPRYDEYTQKAVYEGVQYPKEMLPIWSFAEEGGYVLSRMEGTGEPAVIWKQYEDYNSVHSLHLAPAPQLLQQIALLSGVHLYNRTYDVIYAGGEYIGLSAMQDGYRRLCLPERGFWAENALTGEAVSVNDMFIDLKMKKGEVVLLHIWKKRTAECFKESGLLSPSCQS